MINKVFSENNNNNNNSNNNNFKERENKNISVLISKWFSSVWYDLKNWIDICSNKMIYTRIKSCEMKLKKASDITMGLSQHKHERFTGSWW